jgi:uncharacterized coiled-coil protein SlyX
LPPKQKSRKAKKQQKALSSVNVGTKEKQHYFATSQATMPPPKNGSKWNITNHFISPLLFFALGMMVASTMKGIVDHESVSAAPGTQTRLVELMGEVNDLEITVSDLKRQLAEKENKCDKLENDLSRTRDDLAKAQQSQGAASAVEENWDKEVEAESAYIKSIADTQGKNVKWSKIGNWQMTDLEPLTFINKFDIGYGNILS